MSKVRTSVKNKNEEKAQADHSRRILLASAVYKLGSTAISLKRDKELDQKLYNTN